MASGVRFALVVAALLLAALLVVGILVFDDRPAGSRDAEVVERPDEADGSADQAEAPTESRGRSIGDASVGSEPANDDEPGLGEVEVRIEQPEARLAIIGPDRYFRVDTRFAGGTFSGLTPGSYLVVGTAEGHDAAAWEAEVAAGQDLSVSLDLRKAGGN
jgi:hypothetical protein